MRDIQKGQEPQSLTQHRSNTHSDYNNYPHKDDLRQALVLEQGGICCYCMQRIRPNSDDMKIEHWHSQSPNKYPNKQLDYANLLGACKGGEGQGTPHKQQHCDTRKSDSDLSRNPANSAHQIEPLLKYLPDGTIISTDPQFDQELNDVLNLNLPLLINNRKAVLDAFTKALSGNVGNLAWQRILRKWENNNGGELEAYCGIVIFYIRRKLNRG